MSTSIEPSAPRVVVVGGGVAGMAAAVALEAAGATVTLLEARRSLGGRAAAYQDPQSGDWLDNCQHVLLGCCTNLLDFYRRLDALDQIRFEPETRFLHAGRWYALRGTRGLPAPLHLGPGGLRFSLLTWRERIELARASLAMMRLGREGRERLSDTPFGEWLDAQGQSESLIRKLYEPVLIGSLNEDVRKANAKFAIQVFQDSLFAHADGWQLGVPTGTLGDLYRNLPLRDVRLGARVAGLAGDEKITGVRLADGQTIDADAVVLATNFHGVAKWLPGDWATRDGRFAGLDRIRSVPILGCQLWFDRPVLPQSHAAFIDGPLQWVFREDAEGRVVKGVISAAREWVGRPKDDMLRLFESQLLATLPGAAGAKLLRGTVVIEKRATFAAVPGVDRDRPQQAPPPGGLAGLYLAGDYTKTGWPATMEGAVRSGYLAAEAILAAAGRPTKLLVADLPVQWPTRLLGLRFRGKPAVVADAAAV